MTYDEAWERVDKGERFEDPDILKLANNNGGTIAHAQAYRDWTTEDPDILRLTDSFGWTVAHLQARRGWTTLDPDILSLRDEGGTTVLDILLRYGNWKPQTEEEKLIVFTVKAGA